METLFVLSYVSANMVTDFGKEINKLNRTFELRKKRDNLTVSALARASGRSRITVYTVLKGGRYRKGKLILPTLDSVMAVAGALGHEIRVGRKRKTA